MCAGTAYVFQEDLFFSHLTVEEHLYFHAVNRLGDADLANERVAWV